MAGRPASIIDQRQRSSCVISVSEGMVAELGPQGHVVTAGQCSGRVVVGGRTERNRFAYRLFGASNGDGMFAPAPLGQLRGRDLVGSKISAEEHVSTMGCH
ncbi:hypothetical protein [Mycobacteroides salmoniphilum]|nr:hypothetical protein [Mycobacteroides salmoniphilum]